MQSIYDLTSPAGRLGRQRQALIDGVARSRFLTLVKPMGALYGFLEARTDKLPTFDDNSFAMALLEKKHVLVAPGTSFNIDYNHHFRMTFLPDEDTLREVFDRIESLLTDWR